jgi:flavin-dependent dehydrogenase
VLLLDRADFPRDKCCGDGIAPHVVEALAEVGAQDVVAGWRPLHRLELSHGRIGVRRRMARPVWVVPRSVLDARLVEHAAAAGARVLRHRVRELRRDTGETVLDGVHRARVVVGADGAHSVVRAAVGRPQVRRRAIAVRGYAPTREAWRAGQVIAYGDGVQPSYAWAFDRGDGLSNVGYGELLGARAAPPSRALLMRQLERLVPGAVATGDGWRGHHLPLAPWRWGQPDGPVLLAGDAAGLVNPMSGEGIYYAVASGLLAGRAAARTVLAGRPECAGAAYRSALRGLLARHLRHIWLASRLSRHSLVVDAGIRACGRDQGVFDDLVEAGLGRGELTVRLAAGLVAGLCGPRSAGAGSPQLVDRS